MPRLNAKHVLLVEDEAFYKELFRKFLSRHDFHVTIANNGQIALKLLEKKIFDLVITDWSMPIMNGLEFLKQFKANNKNAKIPIVMLTAQNTSDKIREALTLGLNGFLIKPCNMQSVENLLKKLKLIKK